MLKRFTFAVLAGALLIAPLAAQIRGAGSGMAGFGISAARPGSTGMRSREFAGGGAHFRQGHPSERGSLLLPYPYFYSDSDYEYGESSQPQIVVVQASTPAPPPEAPAPRESLLIEWQGDHFERTTSAKASTGAEIAGDYSEKSDSRLSAAGLSDTSVSRRTTAGRLVRRQKDSVQSPRELPPAVLVFHDGRNEEVSEYTIMNGTIYSKADYWTTGSWTRKIQIADLDVPATLKLNQERGLKFMLPASPNEIVIRP
jgi:hypothetical protein